MKSVRLKKYMVPLNEYANVHQDATLRDAVLALEKALAEFDPTKHRHRAILVHDGKGNIVGKLSQWDVIKALEPQYQKITDFKHSMRFGFSHNFIRDMISKYDLWQTPLDHICEKAAHIIVKDIMYAPAEGEYIREDATFDEAVHMLVIGHHQGLLVTDTEGKKVIGILRLADVFVEVCRLITTCPKKS